MRLHLLPKREFKLLLAVFGDSQDLTCKKSARTAKCLTLGRTDLPLKFHPAATESRRVSRRAARVEQRASGGADRVAQPIARREVAQRGTRPPLVVIVDPVRNP
jgi:hypothetical protein